MLQQPKVALLDRHSALLFSLAGSSAASPGYADAKSCRCARIVAFLICCDNVSKARPLYRRQVSVPTRPLVLAAKILSRREQAAAQQLRSAAAGGFFPPSYPPAFLPPNQKKPPHFLPRRAAKKKCEQSPSGRPVPSVQPRLP